MTIICWTLSGLFFERAVRRRWWKVIGDRCGGRPPRSTAWLIVLRPERRYQALRLRTQAHLTKLDLPFVDIVWPEGPRVRIPSPPAWSLLRTLYTTNAVESLNRSLRKIIKPRGGFPNDEAALKLLFLAIRNAGIHSRRPIEWTAAIGQFAILFGDRFEPSAR
jgi:hypothetical protein